MPPTTFELVINLHDCQRARPHVPQLPFARADEVIE